VTKYRQCDMPLSSEDKTLIKHLYQFKEYGLWMMLKKHIVQHARYPERRVQIIHRDLGLKCFLPKRLIVAYYC